MAAAGACLEADGALRLDVLAECLAAFRTICATHKQCMYFCHLPSTGLRWHIAHCYKTDSRDSLATSSTTDFVSSKEASNTTDARRK